MRNQGEGGEGRRRMWMTMTASVEARVRRTAPCCLLVSLAKGNGHLLGMKEFSTGLLPPFSSLTLYVATARVDSRGSEHVKQITDIFGSKISRCFHAQ
jgi:hypothetical protein